MLNNMTEYALFQTLEEEWSRCCLALGTLLHIDTTAFEKETLAISL